MLAFFCGVYATMALLFIFINFSLTTGAKERITAVLMGIVWLPVLIGLMIYGAFFRKKSQAEMDLDADSNN